jgi:hypothetical protein
MNGMVYCLNASSGTYQWNFLTRDVIASSPAVVDSRVYVGSFDDRVYCLNASTGAHLWNFTTGGDVFASPAIANGRVYVGSNDNGVYGFGTRTFRYDVKHDGHQFLVKAVSNSFISMFTFDQSSMAIRFNVTGPTGIGAFCTVTFPTSLLGGPFVCQLDRSIVTPGIATNATHTTLTFTYTHSTRAIEVVGTTVIPEFPSILAATLLLLALGATLLRVNRKPC